MKNHSLLTRLFALALALLCVGLPAAAEAVTSPSEYVAVDGPSANSDLAFGSVCILNGCRTIDSYVPLAGSDRLLDTAQSAFAFERSTGTLVYAYNADLRLPAGSLAKMVVALLALEYCDVDEVLTVKQNNRFPTGGLDLKNEEELTVNDLLHALIMKNAADAAIVLSDRIAGNTAAMVTLMNNRARQMGCNNTNFTNVYGGDNTDAYTTARDMARITAECTKNDKFNEIFSATSYTIPATNRSDERTFESTNYFVDSKNIPKYYDSRVTSGMQSYGESIGASLVCTATAKSMDMIFVVMGCTRQYYENGWQVKVYGNFDEAQTLINYVFNNFKSTRVLYNGQALKQFSVTGGDCNLVAEPHLDLDTILPKDAHMDNLIMEYTDTGLTAPISKGDMVATVEVWYRNTCLHEAELYAMQDIRTTSNSGLEILGGADRSGSESRLSGYALRLCLIVLIGVACYLGLSRLLRLRRRQKTRRRRKNRRHY